MSAAPDGLGSGAMFDAIAGRYDVVNRVISLGLDQGWRRRAVDALALPARGVALDLATGTGDLAIAIQRAYPGARVIGADPSPKMLAVEAAPAAAPTARPTTAPNTSGESDVTAPASSSTVSLHWPGSRNFRTKPVPRSSASRASR